MVGRSFEKTENQYLTENSGTSNPIPQQQGGLFNEGGDLEQIKNVQFLKALYRPRPDGSTVAVCSKSGDPNEGGWTALKAMKGVSLLPSNNNYANCSTFYPVEDADFNVKKENFAALHVVVLDDIGTKIPWSQLNGIKPTWVIETSPGNCQLGFGMKEPVTDIERAEALINAVISAGFSDKGMSGVSRWYRVPNAINGKEKYLRNGQPFRCRLHTWNPDARYTVEELDQYFKLNLLSSSPAKEPHADSSAVLQVAAPAQSNQPVIKMLKEMGLYKNEIAPGKYAITCPWVAEHTDALDDGTAYFEPNKEFPQGGFKCHHSHDYDTHDFLRYLGLERPTIKLVAGNLDSIVDECEKIIAESGEFYYFGGMIGRITESFSFEPLNLPNLMRELSKQISFLKFNEKKDGWFPCDLAEKYGRALLEEARFKHIPELKGIVRQPYFRDIDGELVTTPGYDPESKLYGIFDPGEFVRKDPTREEAEISLKLLRDLLSEFSFASPDDEAIALNAIFTAAVRSFLDLAPGFHVHASTIASGKSYLCELISLFSSGGSSEKVTYPKTSDEATKMLLSLFLTNPASIEFDDMDGGWKPHSIIKQMFTSPTVTGRILGVSKTAKVATRSLILGSGNNVKPERDLLRRVLTIHLDPKVETPATIKYANNPVATLKAHRGEYVMAVINIIESWQKAERPRTDMVEIASYNGLWTEYCRQPLAWLGISDPAKVMIEQINLDPDKEALGELLRTWFNSFGNTPTTVRKAVDSISEYGKVGQADFREELDEALQELPVMERDNVNKKKLGWFLSKNENKIVDGLKFIKTRADGRTAWMVI